MSEATTADRAAAARERIAARARAVSRIRKRVAAATIASFVLAWAAIAHGGSMGATSDNTTATTASKTSTATSGDSSTTTTTSPSPVTTAQS